MQNQRCDWCNSDPLYITYHDQEWGVPLTDDAKLFELIVLEGMQAGLSWLTVLKKRAAIKQAFCDLVPHEIAKLSEQQLLTRLNNPQFIHRYYPNTPA